MSVLFFAAPSSHLFVTTFEKILEVFFCLNTLIELKRNPEESIRTETFHFVSDIISYESEEFAGNLTSL